MASAAARAAIIAFATVVIQLRQERAHTPGAKVLVLASNAPEVWASENGPAPPAVTIEQRHAYLPIPLREVRRDFRAC